ncbi:hypothetical protein HNR23_001298 [Nocardiopsis mwathae]|uniref:DUF3159 domain-containing protein n=1 Tax=Nocardiopsis mwathae TaxID=1472723 RepID=A0A7W9YFI6_9ACTN|nr:DUF3159 domain-containing protein [Nocardiopsis mwathae]MBB6171238.1 hypothetical protein [Nocardiopsis mwathae]
MTDQQRAVETSRPSPAPAPNGGTDRPGAADDAARTAPEPPQAAADRGADGSHGADGSNGSNGAAGPRRDGADGAPEPSENGEQPQVSEQTVEAVVRAQLSKALGGKRGMVEAAVPTIAFTVTYIVSQHLQLALGLGVGAAVALALVRIVQRSSVQFVFNSLFGIGIAAIFALRSGEAEDAFLPGIIYNAVYALVLIGTIVIRWPAVGLLIGSVTGDPTGWRDNPAVVKLSSRLTWLLVLPCVIRVAVQYPLWAAASYGIADTFALLGIAKIAMGWPLQVAALAAMVWLLARGRTAMDGPTLAPPRDRDGDGT